MYKSSSSTFCFIRKLRRFSIPLIFIIIVLLVFIYIQFIFGNTIHYVSSSSPSSIIGLYQRYNCSSSSKDEKIPRIVHQIIISNDDNGEIPSVWNVTHQSILTHHPNYRHILWTDRTMSQFLFDNYRSFLPIFESYPFPIQRVDAFRYFALYHFGGIYADLDVGARRPFDALLQYDAFLPHTLPFGFNNDFIGSRPRHPLFRRIIAAMPAWNRYYLSPYATIMMSTGPAFMSVCLLFQLNCYLACYHHRCAFRSLQYHFAPVADIADVRVIDYDLYKGDDGLCLHAAGQTWHSWDAFVFLWLGTHLHLAAFIALLLTLVLFYVCARLTCCN